jgi:hypothetical protein
MVDWFFCEETNHDIWHSNNVCLYASRLIVAYVSRTRYIAGLFLFWVENAPTSSGPIWKEIEEKN